LLLPPIARRLAAHSTHSGDLLKTSLGEATSLPDAALVFESEVREGRLKRLRFREAAVESAWEAVRAIKRDLAAVRDSAPAGGADAATADKLLEELDALTASAAASAEFASGATSS
jgi:hypothetical protein